MDNKKKWGIFIVGTALIIIIALALFIYFLNKKNAPQDNEPKQTNTDEVDKLMLEAKQRQANPNYTFDPQVERQRPLNSEDIKQMALAFAERFGSYSNQSNYDNIRDLKIFMTENMQDWSDNYIAELERRNTEYQNYYGITTIAIAGEVKQFDDKTGKAEVVVSTQRREVKNINSNPQNYNQDIRLTFIKTDNQWQVDGAFWIK